MDQDDYRQTREWLMTDLADANICIITPEVIRYTLHCLENYTLRAMDAIHIGCALASAPDVFISADRRQIQAARGEGLHVVEIVAA